jgi:hypothetical protein
MSRRFQFSLKFMFLATTALAVWLGAQVNRVERERKITAAVAALGGEVYYDYQLASDGTFVKSPSAPGPLWLRRWLGDDFFASIHSVIIEGIADEQLITFDNCSELRGLMIFSDGITDVGVNHLSRFTDLTWLTIESDHVTVEGLTSLSGLHNLKYLGATATPCTEPTMERIRKLMPQCTIETKPMPLWQNGSPASVRIIPDVVWEDIPSN